MMPTAPPLPPPPHVPLDLPDLPSDVLLLIFDRLGWLEVPRLRRVSAAWRDAVEAFRLTQTAVRVCPAGRWGDVPPVGPCVTSRRLLEGVRFYSPLLTLSLGPRQPLTKDPAVPTLGKRRRRSRRPTMCNSSTSVLAELLRSWPTTRLGDTLVELNLTAIGAAAPCAAHAAALGGTTLRPRDFSVLRTGCTRLRVLCVARCRWWSNAYVASLLGVAPEDAWAVASASHLDALLMADTSVTVAAVTAAWSAGVRVIDASRCSKVGGDLFLSETWPAPPIGAGAVVAGGDVSSLGGGVASRRDGRRRPLARAILKLCGTRLSAFGVSGGHRTGRYVDLNTSKCKLLVHVDVNPASVWSASFSDCRRLAAGTLPSHLWSAGSRVALEDGGVGAGAFPRPEATATVGLFPALRCLTLWRCSAAPLDRLVCCGGALPSLQRLVVHGVEGLTGLVLDDLPALELADASGCPAMEVVSVAGCPALRRVDLRCKRAPLERVSVILRGGGQVLGLRPSWCVWSDSSVLHVRHG